MIESIIFILIFASAIMTALVCSWGWLKECDKNKALICENQELEETLYYQHGELEKIKAENRFLKLQLEDK